MTRTTACTGVTGQCHNTATHRVSWRTPEHRRRQRARMCERCVALLRRQVGVSDLVATRSRRAS